MSPQICCVIYSDTLSTNISKYNIFDTDYFANLHVNMAGTKYVNLGARLNTSSLSSLYIHKEDVSSLYIHHINFMHIQSTEAM